MNSCLNGVYVVHSTTLTGLQMLFSLFDMNIEEILLTEHQQPSWLTASHRQLRYGVFPCDETVYYALTANQKAEQLIT